MFPHIGLRSPRQYYTTTFSPMAVFSFLLSVFETDVYGSVPKTPTAALNLRP
jgi:hypothetical protein